MTPKNILRTIKNPVVEKLARDNDRMYIKLYKWVGIQYYYWNTILLLASKLTEMFEDTTTEKEYGSSYMELYKQTGISI